MVLQGTFENKRRHILLVLFLQPDKLTCFSKIINFNSKKFLFIEKENQI